MQPIYSRILSSRTKLSLSLLVLCSPLSVNLASAQEESVEVISVTASKQAQSLNTIASSVSVVDASTLELIEAQHINQVLSRVAGTWISRGNGQEHLTALRSPVLTGAGSCGAFFMAQDGISLRAPGFCNANQLFDANSEQAARIEVLKGPASTLYGTNALHGAINIISPDAFNDEDNTLGLQLGPYDFARLSGRYSQASGDQAFLLQSNIVQENGFQDQSGYDQQKLSAIYQSRSNTWDNKTFFEFTNLNQETAGFVQGFRVYEDEQLRRENPNPEAFRDAKSLRAYSAFTREVGEGLLSIKPYMRWNEMQFLQHFLPWKGLEENQHSSLGLQIQYDTEFAGASWVSGIDADFTQANLRETQQDPFSPNIPQGEHYDYDVDASVFAAFTQATWRMDRLAFILGARAERTEYDYDNLLSDGSACAPEVAVCRFSRPSDQTLSYTSISPSATAQFSLSEGWMAYAKYSQGFRAPQATELFRLQNNQLSSDIQEVSMDAYELGMRYANNGHRLHIAAYDMLKQDVIVQDTNRQYISDGDTAHQGLEIEYRWQINPQWRLSTNATWQKHTYDSDLQISNDSIEGNRIDTAPERLFAARAQYRPNQKLQAELAWQHLSSYYLDPENTAEYEGHSLFDLTIAYAISDKLRLKVNLLNITDEDYAERADFAFGNYRYFVGQPRRAFFSIDWIL